MCVSLTYTYTVEIILEWDKSQFRYYLCHSPFLRLWLSYLITLRLISLTYELMIKAHLIHLVQTSSEEIFVSVRCVCVCVCVCVWARARAKSCLTLCDQWTVGCPAPLSMAFSRQEYWSQLPFPSPMSVQYLAAKSLQSCPLCDASDGNPPGFPVPGILQARTLERVAIAFSNAGKWKVKVRLLSCVQL